MTQNLGNHLIIEMYDCNKKIINDENKVEQLLIKAVELAGATIVQSVIHKFNPHGVSGVIVIEESHVSIHTWPEYGYCALDIFTCGEDVDYYAALESLKESLQTERFSVTELKRGFLDLPVKLRHKPVENIG